ncbi:MAG: nicotinamidase [Desulfurococcales archaeon]|nr:nicotinamidase [Desulfurococcales archaeon]
MKVAITKSSALVVVDIQNDFCAEDGALPVPGCRTIIENVNRYIEIFERTNQAVVASRDWHPPNHISFKARGGPWPPHCVQGSVGADFYPELKLPDRAIVISKGTNPDAEAYSAFDKTELHYLFSKLGVRRVFVCGVATEYCVKATVEDALELGYEVILLGDAIAGISKESSQRAIMEMIRSGAILAEFKDLLT